LQTFLEFFKKFLLNMFFITLRQKFATTFLLQLAILLEFVILAKFTISPVYISDSRFPLNLFSKIAKKISPQTFASAFNSGYPGVGRMMAGGEGGGGGGALPWDYIGLCCCDGENLLVWFQV